MGKLVKKIKLEQLINQLTWITQSSASLIDLMITDNKNMIMLLDVLPGPVADHEAIAVTLNIKKPKRPPIFKTFCCLKSYSQETLRNLLMNEVNSLNDILNTDNVSGQTSILAAVMTRCINTCAPIVTREILCPPVPWISDDIKISMKRRDRLQKELKADIFNVILRENYNEQKKKVKSSIDTGRKQYVL